MRRVLQTLVFSGHVYNVFLHWMWWDTLHVCAMMPSVMLTANWLRYGFYFQCLEEIDPVGDQCKRLARLKTEHGLKLVWVFLAPERIYIYKYYSYCNSKLKNEQNIKQNYKQKTEQKSKANSQFSIFTLIKIILQHFTHNLCHLQI